MKLPTRDDWDFSAFSPERRRYLEQDPSFEVIAQRVAHEAVCVFSKNDLLRNKQLRAPEGTWRAWFKICVCISTSDLFYNGRDGLRGRYWQHPTVGAAATRQVLALLKPKLLAYATAHPDCMAAEGATADLHSVERSLSAKSAKIWAHEEKCQNFDEGPKLFVKRWSTSTTEKFWSWAPAKPLLDIKGAFFTSDHSEQIVKPHRDCHIHKYGFS
jgi:hypothetical protein